MSYLKSSIFSTPDFRPTISATRPFGFRIIKCLIIFVNVYPTNNPNNNQMETIGINPKSKFGIATKYYIYLFLLLILCSSKLSTQSGIAPDLEGMNDSVLVGNKPLDR